MMLINASSQNNEPPAPGSIQRRNFLKFSVMTALASAIPAPVWAARRSPLSGERSLTFYNTHTGENLKAVYWVNGRYIPESMADINHILRDHRIDEVKAIDPNLLDLLYSLRRKLGTDRPYHVISGYRSGSTNDYLRARSDGVAQRSLHLTGQAIDIRTPGKELRLLRKAAIAIKGGGVGYYPKSDFVHIDIGPVRYW